MRRPWQIWLLFGLGLAVVVPAMGWLTLKALELDRAESLARRQAELEEDVSRALWRMDSLLTPLLAEEAARPDFVYRPVMPGEEAAGGGRATKKPGSTPAADDQMFQALSPLLADPPQFVLVHFEIHPDGSLTSPQNPTGAANTWALNNGAQLDTINVACGRLEQLRPALDRDWLLAQLPEQPLPVATARSNWGSSVEPAGNTPVFDNNYDSLNQQLVDQTANNPPDQAYLFNPAPQQAEPPQAEARDAQTDSPSQGQQQAYGNNVESGRSQRSQSRVGNDLPNRAAALQQYAQRSYAEQRSNAKSAAPAVRVVEGVSRPLWVGERLLLARRVKIGDETLVQGCWLDWTALRARLRAEVADLLPQVELTPLPTANSIKLSRLLATIPVQLSVPLPAAAPAPWSPIRVSLLAAWACLLLAAVAAAMTLQSVITLSERRGAFVAAVTHELRTPLTTFRMYAEMLAEGMVPDPQQRQRYLTTLRVEADRLSHLVENVLQYARLERGRPGNRRESLSLAALIDHCQTRLADRAAQAELKLLVQLPPELREAKLVTDSAAVEQILFNLVDNAGKYAAAASDKRLHLEFAVLPRQVKIAVRDHGPGISASGRRRLFQPFSKSVHEAADTAPGVGLGLALSQRLAQDLGGRLELQSPPEGGAAFVLTLPR